MLMFVINNLFVFSGTCTVDIQMIVEFLQLIPDFLDSANKVRSSVCIFPFVSVKNVPSWPND